MNTRKTVALFALLTTALAYAGPTFESPEKAKGNTDYEIQGEYSGSLPGDMGQENKIGVQVIAMGKGKFKAVAFNGGLPGDGWDSTGQDTRHEVPEEAEAHGGVVVFAPKNDDGTPGNITAMIKDNALLVSVDGQQIASLSKVARISPTMGKKPPEGAVVLFDGTTPDHFVGGKMTEDKLLMQGVTSKEKFGDHTVHVEFRLPFQPEDRGQARGNSGIYLLGRYEVQMLDSFGLLGVDNECGGIYKVGKPAVNMCFPPLAWQTYDIDVTAAKFDAEGKKTANARMTVFHNGVKIHDNIEIPAPTTAAPVTDEKGPGPVYLQDHGNPVRYRNIWVLPKK